MDEIRLSFVIPCYNMEKYLSICMDSLLDQGLTPEEHEIIIVNDGSADRTLEIARGYEARYSQVQVIDKKNAGVGAARNSGFDLARGRYIHFIDPDDYLARNTMPLVLKKAEENELDILGFRSKMVKPKQFIPKTTSPVSRLEKQELKVTDGIEFIADYKFHNEIWWFIVSKAYMQAFNLRFIEGRWMEDAILSAELFCSARRASLIDFDVHRYRVLPTSAMRNKTPEHYNKVIFDNANAALVFDGLLKDLNPEHPFYEPAYKRLKTRQQSFVFFLLVRLMKSDLKLGEIPPMLREFEKVGAYPLDQFLGPDYQGFAYSFMVYIFNRKPLIKPFMRFFRVFYRIVR